MTQLVVFGALQGFGAGVLIAIGSHDRRFFPPRDRGRCKGYFGSVFASPVSPARSWAAISRIVPAGAGFSMSISRSAVPHLPFCRTRSSRDVRRGPRIDYLGAAIIVSAVTAFLLYLNWAAGCLAGLNPDRSLVGLPCDPSRRGVCLC